MPSSRRAKAADADEAVGDSEGEELVDTTARLELRSRRTERKQKQAARRLEKRALAAAPATITDLPTELLVEVLSLLRPSDVLALQRASRTLHAFLSGGARDTVARAIVRRRYPCLERCFRPPALLASMGGAEREALRRLRAGPAKGREGRTWRLRPGQLQHVGPPPPDALCECVTCTLRWVGLSIAVDFAHWQDHLDRGRPVEMIKPGQRPAWNVDLTERHAAIVARAVLGGSGSGSGDGGDEGQGNHRGGDGKGDQLWYALILEKHLASTVRSIRRHAANKGNKRRRFLLTDEDARAETDAFLERSGPPTIDYPYHRDNYYMLEAYLPNRSWSGDTKRWMYIPTEQHERDVAYIMARQAANPDAQPQT